MSPNKMLRLCKRSSKQKRSDTQIGLKTAPAPLERPASFAYSELQGPSQDHLGFPDGVYLLASVIFQNVHLEKPAGRKLVNYGNNRSLPLPEVKTGEHRTAYELAFSTLKYQDFLEAIITDSFGVAPPVSHDDMSLFLVMLYDFQGRKFLPRQGWENEESVPAVTLVEKAILGFKTKLAASLARHRIRHQLTSFESFLPETLKIKQERSERLPTYAWVNALKSSPEEIQRALTNEGFHQVKSVEQLADRTFFWDRHCADTLAFPASCRSQLYSTGLLSDHRLVIQDKSCGLGPNAAFSLLPDDADVLVSGRFSGLTVSHTAALVARKGPPDGARPPQVYVCVGDLAEAQREELERAVAAVGCENVTLIPEGFQSLCVNDRRLQRSLVVLLTPECSLSAVSNPVEIVLQENRDPKLLQELSQGSVGLGKLTTLVVEQQKAVDHALKFPKVSAVVYSTYSTLAEENEEVVTGALQKLKASFGQAGEPEAAGFSVIPSPFSKFKNNESMQNEDKFFKLKPSEESNGCFLAVLKRDPEPVVKELPREVILKACTKGILDGIGPRYQPSEKMPQDHRGTIKKQHRALGTEPRPAVMTQTKPLRTKSSCGGSTHQLMSHTQASLAKAKQQQAAKTSKGTSPAPAAPLRQKSNTSSTSSPKPDHITFKKSICCPSTVLPAASRATDAPPAVRPHLEPKQVQLTLPVIQYQPLHSRGWNPSQKVEAPSSFSASKSVMLNSKHLFRPQNK